MDTFLIGTHPKGNSLIKYLPEDILITIADQLVDITSEKEVINKCWIYGFERKLKQGIRMPIETACKTGNLNFVKHIGEKLTFKSHAMTLAAIAGHFHIAEWLYTDHGIRPNEYSILNATLTDNFAAMDWLFNHGGIIDEHVCEHAIRTIEMLEWVHARTTIGQNTFLMAFFLDNLEAIKWIFARYPHYLTNNVTVYIKSPLVRKWFCETYTLAFRESQN